MRIKRIEIHGFKSFADKTELELGAGLTAVVGPNGSGKSNLAEAVKWVLGEQSARILRGQRMDDIIFSGTAKRKGVGYAEVSLVFDNAEKRLPLEYSEVVITRRIYRSGDGEYLINRKSCRLRDITELFLDTGVGKDSYSFVGQGRIEEILNADPRQRRGIFEEAAGISRYKLRKRETETRLDEVQANLRRVSDIEAELQMQLAPLEEDAERAKIYLELQSSRDTWEKELLLYELGLAERQVSSIKTQFERASDESRARESQLSILEAERSEFGLRHSALISEVGRLEADLRMVEHNKVQLNERIAELEAEAPTYCETANRLRNAITDTEAKLATIEQELATKHLELRDVEEALQECQTTLSSLSERLSPEETDTTYTDLAGQRVESVERIAALKAEIESGERSLSRMQEFRVKTETEVDRINASFTATDSKKRELHRRQAESRSHLTKFKEERGRLVEEAARCRDERIREEKRARELESELFQMQRKLDNLRRADEQYEGLTRAARHVLELSMPGVKGVLARLIEVSSPYTRAIEMSLGAALSDVVVTDEKTARRAIAELKDHKVGRATFYPLDIFRARPPRVIPDSLCSISGYRGRASELVKCPDFVTPVVKHLLQNVLIVDDLDIASIVAGKTGYGFRIMTLEGDMMLPGGSMSGGSLPVRTGNLLGRQQEMDDAERVTRQRESDLASSRSRLLSLSGQVDDANNHLNALEQAIQKGQTEIAALTESISAASGECDFLQRSKSVLQARLTDQLSEVAQSNTTLESMRADLERALVLRDELESSLTAMKSAQEERLRVRQEHIERQRDLEVEQARTAAKRELLVHVCYELNGDLNEARLQYGDLQTRLGDADMRVAAAQTQIENIQLKISALDSQKRDLEQTLTNSYEARQTLQARERDNLAAITACKEAIESGRSRLHALEIRQVRVDGELESLSRRLVHDHPGESLRNSTLSNRNEAESRIGEIDQQIADLGDVRVSSISECRRLQERLSFLASEREDLYLASGKLVQAISELDTIMAARFVDNFVVVQREFAQVAERLFAGGAARVSMVDPSAPLDTGIEIDVQPPGKRLQNIRLLSGGERALAAVSLLCAVLRVKPTPFCVLDEVDAALDDANVERLIPVLRELSTHTQFLLVTHTKSTMLAADILYGVTMPEQGVSKVLSVRVSDVSAQSQEGD